MPVPSPQPAIFIPPSTDVLAGIETLKTACAAWHQTFDGKETTATEEAVCSVAANPKELDTAWQTSLAFGIVGGVALFLMMRWPVSLATRGARLLWARLRHSTPQRTTWGLTEDIVLLLTITLGSVLAGPPGVVGGIITILFIMLIVIALFAKLCVRSRP